MPGFTASTKKMSKAEFRQQLQEVVEGYTPEKAADELVQRLRTYERKYGLSSTEFFAKYLHGEMGDDREIMSWAGDYQSYLYLLEELMPAQEVAA
jgi:hypothetical protein